MLNNPRFNYGDRSVDLSAAYNVIKSLDLLSLYQQNYPAGQVKQLSSFEYAVTCIHPDRHNNGDANPSMHINSEKKVYHCKGCEARGNQIDLLKHAYGMEWGPDLTTAVLGPNTPYREDRGDNNPTWSSKAMPPFTDPRHSQTKVINDLAQNTVREQYYYTQDGDKQFRNTRVEKFKGEDRSKSSRDTKTFFAEFWDTEKGKWEIYKDATSTRAEALGYDVKSLSYGTNKGETLLLVEGEKCVNFCQELGLGSFTLSKLANKEQALSRVESKLIVVLVDNDTAGEKWCEDIEKVLTKLGKDYRVIKWSDHGVPPAGDIEEYLQLPGRSKETFLDLLTESFNKPPAVSSIKPANLVVLPNRSNQQPTSALQKPNRPLAIEYVNASLIEIKQLSLDNKWSRDEFELFLGLLESQRERDKCGHSLRMLKEPPVITFADVLPDVPLRGYLSRHCRALKVEEVALVAALFTIGAGMIQLGTELELHGPNEHLVPPFLFTLLVSRPGGGKTPLLKPLRKALTSMFSSVVQKYEEDHKQWKKDYFDWERGKKGREEYEEPPAEPILNPMYLDDFTPEAALSLISKNPNYPILGFPDEASAMFAERGRYSSAKSSAGDRMSSLYNGETVTVFRKGEGVSFSAKAGAVILGGIQPHVLQNYVKSLPVQSGQIERFLIVPLVETGKRTIETTQPKNCSRVDFTGVLVQVFQELRGYAPRTYGLSPDAYTIFSNQYNRYVDERESSRGTPLEGCYSKAQEIIGRFALVLHLLSSAVKGSGKPDSLITKEAMSQAVLLADFYVFNMSKQLSSLDPANGIFLEVFEHIKSGAKTPSDIMKKYSGKKLILVRDNLPDWLSTLEESGSIKLAKSSNRKGVSIEFIKDSVLNEGVMETTENRPQETVEDAIAHQPRPDLKSVATQSLSQASEKSTQLGVNSPQLLGPSGGEDPLPTGRGERRSLSLGDGSIPRYKPLDDGKLPLHLTCIDIRYKDGEFILEDAFKDGNYNDIYMRSKSIDDWGYYFNGGSTVIVSVYVGDKDTLFTVKGAEQFTPVIKWLKENIPLRDD